MNDVQSTSNYRRVAATIGCALALVAAACGRPSDPEIGTSPTGPPPTEADGSPSPTSAAPKRIIDVLPGMPPVIDPDNLYSEIRANNLSPAVKDAKFLVYVPNERSGTVTVIDPVTKQVIDNYKTGFIPQHVVPSYDLTRLYALNNNGNTITPFDPKTGKTDKSMNIDNPYNLYYLPDGKAAMVVAEGRQRLDFYDPITWEKQSSTQLQCEGVNHLDFSIDGRFFVASCEFEGTVIKFDVAERKQLGKIEVDKTHVVKGGVNPHPMPQDVRVSPNGSKFYVADMISDGIHVIDAASFTQVGYIPTGVGAHGLYPDRAGKKLYVINRGTNRFDVPKGKGSVAVLDFATDKVEATWEVPGGGSPDMGNITADGKELWLGGRYSSEVYVFDLEKGAFITRIKVGDGPHGLTVWPQPGRFSLGHTGNMR